MLQVGVSNGGWGWGSAFFDFNNDGFLDIVLTNGKILTKISCTTLGIDGTQKMVIISRESPNKN